MTTTVFFVRHGSHDRLDHVLCGRMEGVGLGEQGRKEATRAAERLKAEKIAALYVSPLQRAMETADPIAGALGLKRIEAEALNEIDVGEWTGARFEDLRHHPAWEPWNRDRSQHRAPGGESMLEVQARVARWLADVAERRPDEHVAAVCHSDVIKAGLCYALGLSLDHHSRIEISPGSISVVLAGAWGLKVHSVNEVPR